MAITRLQKEHLKQVMNHEVAVANRYVLCTTTELTTVAYEIFALVMTSVILVLQVRSILNEQKKWCRGLTPIFCVYS